MVATRRSQPTADGQYSQGDLIEILTAGGNTGIGILLRKIHDKSNRSSSSSSSSSPGEHTTHWLVSVQNSDRSEEDISERLLGRILSNNSRSDLSSSGGENDKSNSNITSNTSEKKEGRNSRRVSSRRAVTDDNKVAAAAAAKVSDEDKPKSKSSHKAVTKAAAVVVAKPRATTTKAVAGDKKKTNNHPTAAAAGSRNTRATRRQRGDESELFLGDVGDIEKVKKRPRIAAPTPKVGPNESVKCIKMNTGTLFMYRGVNPRAEFIRTV